MPEMTTGQAIKEAIKNNKETPITATVTKS